MTTQVIESQPNFDSPVILKITNNGIKAEFENKNGRKIYKNIGLQSMAKVLNRDSEFDTGFLPLYGKNYMGVKRYIKMPDKELLFIEGSACGRTVKFDQGSERIQEYPNVQFPGLIMGIASTVQNNGDLKVVEAMLFATSGPIMRDTDRLFNFPYSNVYGDGRLCWGNVRPFTNIKTLTQAGSLLDTFLFNSMNTHLYNTLNGMDIQALLKHMQAVDIFPSNILRTTDLAFRDFISLLKNKNVR